MQYLLDALILYSMTGRVRIGQGDGYEPQVMVTT